MNDLKRCPFCGSENVHTIQGILEGEREKHTFSVACLDCMTGIFSPNMEIGEMNTYFTKEAAETAWNKRTTEEIVRCRDCKKRNQHHECEYGYHSDDWFCADGERR
jgi:hypothetical protein